MVAHRTKSFVNADSWDLEFRQGQTPEAPSLWSVPVSRLGVKSKARREENTVQDTMSSLV
jgi:hypothetical protein